MDNNTGKSELNSTRLAGSYICPECGYQGRTSWHECNKANESGKDSASEVRVDARVIRPENMDEVVKEIPLKWLKYELTHRLRKDIGETLRFIKNLEAIKFSDEECEKVKEIVSADYTTDENGRLVRLEAV